MSRTTDQAGQTLVILVVFIVMSITLALSATAVVIINIRGDNAAQLGEQARANAETGIENALIQLERNPSYTGEAMTLNNGAATITVSGVSPVTIVSVGTDGAYTRTITATATISSNIVNLTSWSETP